MALPLDVYEWRSSHEWRCRATVRKSALIWYALGVCVYVWILARNIYPYPNLMSLLILLFIGMCLFWNYTMDVWCVCVRVVCTSRQCRSQKIENTRAHEAFPGRRSVIRKANGPNSQRIHAVCHRRRHWYCLCPVLCNTRAIDQTQETFRSDGRVIVEKWRFDINSCMHMSHKTRPPTWTPLSACRGTPSTSGVVLVHIFRSCYP